MMLKKTRGEELLEALIFHCVEEEGNEYDAAETVLRRLDDEDPDGVYRASLILGLRRILHEPILEMSYRVEEEVLRRLEERQRAGS